MATDEQAVLNAQSRCHQCGGAAIWHAEFNLITADPARLGPAVVFIEAKVRPEIEGRAGSLGISICTNPEVGVAIFQSVWTSADALQITKNKGLPGREEAVRRAGGGLRGAGYRVPSSRWRGG